jgi:hypothetical protein
MSSFCRNIALLDMCNVSTCSTWPAVDPLRLEAFESERPRVQGWASLLQWFYLRAGLEFPALEELKPDAIPQPYRSLLVHSADMTPTLEAFFQEPLGLIVLRRELHENSYRRQVVLTLGRERQPILHGAIRIVLPRLPPRARQRVLQEQFPLGRILQTEAIPHLSWPQTFFRTEPDSYMASLLRLTALPQLYGRRNILVDGSRRLIAEVIEVLAPVEPSGHPKNHKTILETTDTQ